MASTKELAALFRAIAAENLGAASEVAAQICYEEQNRGHTSAARMLRGALKSPRNGFSHSKRHGSASGLNGADIISTALTRIPTQARLSDVIVTSTARQELENLVLEWQHRDKLLERGIPPRSKLLFIGPPGCGKSLTAKALGAELGLPLFLVRFDAVIGAYLGQTAIHLRELFHVAETSPCILLFDELDALGKRRGNPADVGELDRIVIALMQELEHSSPRGFIIGTSNLAEHLDDALWRRFDFSLEFKRPNRTTLVSFVKRIASRMHVALSDEVTARAAKARSFADSESIVVSEARRQALRNS